MKNKLVHDALVLTMITVIAGAALGVVYEITKAPIAKAQEDALNKSYQAVFADADSFTDVDGFDSAAATQVVADAGIEGVTIDFAKEAVDASGNVKDVKVSRGVSPALDEEAIRIVSASPKWKPGRHRGKKVSTSITIAVEFRLEKKSKVGVGFNGKRIK